MDAKLEAYQRKTGHSVAVWIGKTTGGVPYDQWCPMMHNRWGIGRKGYDDGIVLFVFTDDHYRWLSVGWGLEAAISDRKATWICREVVKPAMESGYPDAGISAGVDAILATIDEWEKRPKS